MATAPSGTAFQIKSLFTRGTATGLNDKQLLGRYVSHRDETAFAVLVARHGPMVMAVCRGALADPNDVEDAFQATFLILIRKAGSIWVDDSLGGWLHRVASRVALQASTDASRRRAIERNADTAVSRLDSRGDLDDLRPLLHAEIDRLPERLRLPIVLCDLEGLTRAEAAGRLRWTEGTVRGRLARGRALLRDRLSRRRQTLLATSLAAALAGEAATALPAASIARALTIPLSDSTSATIASRVIRSLLLSRVKWLAAVALTGLTLIGTSVYVTVAFERPGRILGEPPARSNRPANSPQAADVKEQARSSGRPAAPALDQPIEGQLIEGQLLDLEGRPVAGASVHVPFLYASREGTLDRWIQAVKAREGPTDDLQYKYLKRVFMWGDPNVARAMTDAQGRFVVSLGREWLVTLRIDGPTIRPLEIQVLTRPGAPFQAAIHPQFPQWGTTTYYGSSFRLTAAPTRPIEGVVREQETGLPIAGARIDSTRLADSDVWNNTAVQTTSDAQGRYRLVGLPPGMGNVIVAGPPPRRSYLPVQIEIPSPPGLATIKLDIELARAVTVSGRVTDLRTGKPVACRVEYHAATGNPNLDRFPGFRACHVAHGRLLGVDTAADGGFEIAGLPGPGALVVGSAELSYPGISVGEIFRSFVPMIGLMPQTISRLDIPAGARTFHQDIVLDPGRTVEGTILDPEGKPLPGVQVYGLENLGGWSERPGADSTFQVVALPSPTLDAKAQPQPARSLVFLHMARKLAGWMDLKADERGPVRVLLQPWASAVGQVVDADGKPRADVTLLVQARRPRLGGGQIEHQPKSVRTGADGRFRVEGLAPGLPYELIFWAAPGQGTDRKLAIEPNRPGETRDLGVIAIPSSPEK